MDPQDTNIVNGDMFMDMVDKSEEGPHQHCWALRVS